MRGLRFYSTLAVDLRKRFFCVKRVERDSAPVLLPPIGHHEEGEVNFLSVLRCPRRQTGLLPMFFVITMFLSFMSSYFERNQ